MTEMSPELASSPSTVSDAISSLADSVEYSFVQQEFVNWFNFIFQSEEYFIGTLILLLIISYACRGFARFLVRLVHGDPVQCCCREMVPACKDES